jgi:hypothetical protein
LIPTDVQCPAINFHQWDKNITHQGRSYNKTKNWSRKTISLCKWWWPQKSEFIKATLLAKLGSWVWPMAFQIEESVLLTKRWILDWAPLCQRHEEGGNLRSLPWCTSIKLVGATWGWMAGPRLPFTYVEGSLPTWMQLDDFLEWYLWKHSTVCCSLVICTVQWCGLTQVANPTSWVFGHTFPHTATTHNQLWTLISMLATWGWLSQAP